MRILSMTATFGKLERSSLTLKPGLNILHAPNEWGKSTWCAFLLAMFYGLDTRSRASRLGLPEKERYAPWSGSPMSGRMELCWNGRNITIERSTPGRIPLGSFRAYETDTGMAIPELTADNCGQLLLGVERSVFQRSCFIRFSDLPVTQDDALRQRLNALVTTGDDSGDGAKLEKGLRELKNRCRYNRSGLLPQAMQQRDQLRQALEELDDLQKRQEIIQQELEQNTAQQEYLNNHITALRYRQHLSDLDRIAQAEDALARARKQEEQLEQDCAQLPSPEEIAAGLSQLRAHRRELDAFQEAQRELPLPPVPPQPESCFFGMEPKEAVAQAEADAFAFGKASGKLWWWLLCLGIAGIAGAGVLLRKQLVLPGAVLGTAACVIFILSIFQIILGRKRRLGLIKRYNSGSAEQWRRMAQDYAKEMEAYRAEEGEYRRSREALAVRLQELKQQHQALPAEEPLERMQRQWDALADATQETQQAQREYETLKSMLRPVPPPLEADDCNLTAEETEKQLRSLGEQEPLLRSRAGECRGRMEALGSREALESQFHQLESRIRELEKYQQALALAQETLAQATAELQRRFAPRISREAQQYLSRLTGGKYDRLLLESDFSLLAGTHQENTLRAAQWRSDGTIDQLYLALRLSTAQALTPEAPLILDDALVRFDDERLEAAMELLKELAQSRQVILFTCQARETRFI